MKVLLLPLLLLLFPATAYCLSPLQILVDITPFGGVLKPLPGTYVGPVVITKKIILDGMDQVVIDGDGQGTVLTIKADDVVVRGLRLTNSGDSHDKVDAGILLQGNRIVLENNVIDNALFGIHLKQADSNIVRNNKISSRGDDPTLRGDGIRTWYSKDNLIENNQITDSRDLIFANSPNNRIIGNKIFGGRIGMELIYSPGNEIAHNSLEKNITGLVILYSDEVNLHHNKILNLRNITGYGISIKESSQVQVSYNEIVHCAIGFVVNSPVHPENITYVKNNLLAFNDTGMYFYGEKGGHIITGNQFESNHADILVSAASSAFANNWQGNYWDDYQGFDLNEDGIGDTPYGKYIFSDRLWMDRPKAKFYRGSPALELIDFIERLAPFSDPELILRDDVPLMRP